MIIILDDGILHPGDECFVPGIPDRDDLAKPHRMRYLNADLSAIYLESVEDRFKHRPPLELPHEVAKRFLAVTYKRSLLITGENYAREQDRLQKALQEITDELMRIDPEMAEMADGAVDLFVDFLAHLGLTDKEQRDLRKSLKQEVKASGKTRKGSR